MRYLCTIYSHPCTFASQNLFRGTEPGFDVPVARVVVTGSSLRQAAARAYVRCIGRQRALWLRQNPHAPHDVVADETSPRAIAPSLRKVARRIGECYEMDNFVDAWSIKVDPAPSRSRSRRSRSSSSRLYHLSHSASPN